MKPVFGEILQRARQENGCSLRELSTRSGLDFTRLSRIEHGSRPAPGLSEMRRLAECLSLDLADLLVAAGTPREVVRELLWSERLRMAEVLPDLEAFIPDVPGLLAKNTFRVSIETRDGAMACVRLGTQRLRVLSFTLQKDLTITIPPEAVLVTRSASEPKNVENVLPVTVRKIRHLGQVTNLVLSGDGFELNALHTRALIEAMGLDGGDRLKALIPSVAIRTEPFREES
jgi:transcriptional regulator with XRE-family HTH domain